MNEYNKSNLVYSRNGFHSHSNDKKNEIFRLN